MHVLANLIDLCVLFQTSDGTVRSRSDRIRIVRRRKQFLKQAGYGLQNGAVA